jgi:hypothetical protein
VSFSLTSGNIGIGWATGYGGSKAGLEHAVRRRVASNASTSIFSDLLCGPRHDASPDDRSGYRIMCNV